MAPQPVFQKDEKVLCFHQELLYEANVLDIRQENDDKKGPFEYKVHYRGWKKTWDHWVPQDRLKKLTEENQKLAKSLKEEMDGLRNQSKPGLKASNVKKKGDSSARGSEERGLAISGKKRGRDFDTEKEDAYYNKPAVRIIIPDTLKSMLVDDWENITKNYQLVHIPSKISVNQILDDFLQQEKPKRPEFSSSANILEEVIAGIKEYFNKSLGRLLLYRFERGQYEDVLAKINKPGNDLEGRQLADVYGAEHLLRLFVSLPELIAQTNMDQQSAAQLRKELNDFTLWLSRKENTNKYLATPYENQGSEYQERSGLHEKAPPPEKKQRVERVTRKQQTAKPGSRTSRTSTRKASPVRESSSVQEVSAAQEAFPVIPPPSIIEFGPQIEDSDDEWGRMIMKNARKAIASRRNSAANEGSGAAQS